MDFMNFEGKAVLVTGGNSGIGKGICTEFSRHGAKVAIAARNKERNAKVEALIRAEGGEVYSCSCDVTDSEQVNATVKSVIEKYGRIDILVNCAGEPRDGRFTDMSESDWNFVVNTCLNGTYLVTRAVVPYMIERQYGRIVNISSRAYQGNIGQANYSAAKAGINGFTNALSKELGKHWITANVVAPGLIETDMVRNLSTYEKIAERAINNTPIRRLGQVDDVTAAVLFFASEEAGFLSGEILHVAGGRKG